MVRGDAHRYTGERRLEGIKYSDGTRHCGRARDIHTLHFGSHLYRLVTSEGTWAGVRDPSCEPLLVCISQSEYGISLIYALMECYIYLVRCFVASIGDPPMPAECEDVPH